MESKLGYSGGSPRGRGARRSPPPIPLRGGNHRGRGRGARRWGHPRPRRSPPPPPHRGGRPRSPCRPVRHTTAPAHRGAGPAANPPPRAHVRAGALRGHLRHHGPAYQRAGPRLGGRAPTAAEACGEEVEVRAPVLTLDNIHLAALPILDARRRIRGHVRGSLVEGLRERLARGGHGALYIPANVLAAELGAGYVGFLGRPRVLAIVHLDNQRRRMLVDERLHVLAAEEARVENELVVDEVAPRRADTEERKEEGLGQHQDANSEELGPNHRNQDQGADEEQILPRLGEDQGAHAEEPDEHLDGDAVAQLQPDQGADQGAHAEEPDEHLDGDAVAQLQLDLGAHAEQARPGEDQQPVHPHEAADLLELLQETYTLMEKKYDDVERLWEEKRALDREATVQGDWSGIAIKHRGRSIHIEKATQVYREASFFGNLAL
ncbi:uncharacterized protein LOC110435727 [Sorghum bicolor]|uniref:uncharacterized protein LOC110435727 n=1 Tax=Sorghum bicolor TaxID=4558 RepID=UPI000B424CEB|nr:uncharacterized protein LOC110435727 [Sorghum bicolor]|eukprot:XP_021317390.1 uncharacterized protein LOC110435727 [Sorghum bicolor]